MKKIILQDQHLNQLVGSVTQRLLKGKFFSKGLVSGDEIVEFSTHHQVNHFVLFQIFQDWNAHIQKFNHPYFNFAAPDVKEGMRVFLNILSQNIRVPEADFKRMLQQAVYNTIKLILNPEDAISNFFFQNSTSIPIHLFKKHAPYFRDFDFVIKPLGKFFEKKGAKQIEKKLFFEKFSKAVQIFEKKKGESIYEYQKNLFKSLTGQDLDGLPKRSDSGLDSHVKSQTQTTTEAKPAAKPVEAKPEREDVPDWIKNERKRRQTNSGSNNVTEAPKVEKPKIELPKVEAPKVKKPKVEIPKIEAPKVEAPKVEKPKVEVPKMEAPKVEKQKPEIPKIGTPKVDAPKNESPKIQAPESGEKEKTISDQLKENQKDKPRSLNEMFANREKSGGSILDKNQDNQQKVEEEGVIENKPKRKVASLLGMKRPVAEPKKEEAAEEKSKIGDKKSTINLFAQAKKAESDLKEKRTIGEQLNEGKKKGKSNLNDKIGNKTIKTDQIPVHKQFQFVQKVFGGSSVKFKVVLDKINKTQNLEEAESVLSRYVFNDPNVNRKDKVCQEFENLVRDRFE